MHYQIPEIVSVYQFCEKRQSKQKEGYHEKTIPLPILLAKFGWKKEFCRKKGPF